MKSCRLKAAELRDLAREAAFRSLSRSGGLKDLQWHTEDKTTLNSKKDIRAEWSLMVAVCQVKISLTQKH